jgi:hypothetical protein
MAFTFYNTHPINDLPPPGWKQHVCAGCGATYRFTISEGPPGQRRVSDVNERPCPACGVFQPEMVGGWKSFRHSILLLISIGIEGLGYVLGTNSLLDLNVAAMFIAAGWVLTAGLHLAVFLHNRNAHLAVNRAQAERLVRSGQMVLHSRRTNAPPEAAPSWVSFSPAGLAGLALVWFAIAGAAAPEAVRLAHGWPLNRDFNPPVLGPGDTSRLYFQDTISSISGYWNGAGTCTCLNSADLGTPATFTTLSPATQWATSLRVLSKERSVTNRLWTDIQVPSTPGLEGKAAELRVDLTASFPQAQGQKFFTEGSHSVSRQLTLRIASAGAAETYSKLWELGLLFGFAAVCLGGLILNSVARSLLPSE